MRNPAPLVPVFVTPAVQQLLHALEQQLLAEARRDVAAQLADPAPAYTRQEHRVSGENRVICCSDEQGNELRLQTPLTADPGRPYLRPGLWYGSETRLDTAGRRWIRHVGDYVQDDFGTLVPVPGRLQ